MRSDILNVGDVVTIHIAKDNRDWGYNPCPDGSRAEVLGFSTSFFGRLRNCGKKPGVYTNRQYPKLRLLATGQELNLGLWHIGGLVDSEDEKRRAQSPYQDRTEFLKELPPTPFWESDVVLAERRQQVVNSVDFGSLESKRNDGSPWPAYELSDSIDGGVYRSFAAEDLTLVRRGPVWNIAHGVPVTFGSVQDEAKLAHLMGLTREAVNPATGNYAWSHDEVLDALERGVVHGFTVARGLFGSPTIYEHAIMFDDAALGERVRQHTLRGFGLTARP